MLTFQAHVKELRNYGYNTLLGEELTDNQKIIVDTWGPNTKATNISKHVIPHGQDRTFIPLEHPDDDKPATPHPDVKAHLEKHGYQITDYRGNKAKEPKYGREIRIGKALAATGASKELISTFNNDPKRATAKSGNLGVVISRHPHDVAGMSTDRGWTSCMDMEGGCNRHYLKRDVEQGTHVAYLVHEHDKEAKKPLARIALKPFKSGKSAILRPEGRTYGTGDNAFSHTVRKWAETNFPAKEDKIYKKSSKLYNDDNKDIVAHPSALLKSIDHDERAEAFDKNDKNVTPEHISQGLKDSVYMVRKAAVSHPKATHEHISEGLNDPDSDVRRAAVSNQNATHEHISQGMKDKDVDVRRAAVSNQNATHEHISQGLKDEDYRVALDAVRNPNATHEHISQGLNDKNATIRLNAIRNPNATHEHISKALNDNEDIHVKLAAIRHPNLSSEHITKALNINHPGLKANAIQHKNVTNEHISKALDDENRSVNENAIRNPHIKLSSENMDKALNHKNPEIRATAVKRPEATSEQLHKALNDEHPYVRMHVMENPNITKEHLDKAVDDKDTDVRLEVAKHPKATPEHLKKLVQDEDEWVRRRARAWVG